MTLDEARESIERLYTDILCADDGLKIDAGLCGAADCQVAIALTHLETAALHMRQAELFQATALGA